MKYLNLIFSIFKYYQFFRMLKKIGLSFGALTAAITVQFSQTQQPQFERNAICILYPNNSKVRGIVSFNQNSIISPLKIVCSIKNLTPNGNHGIHIHEYGDLTQGCKTAGTHYNPFQKNHGGLNTQERHIGDLGNITADQLGNAYVCLKTSNISLFGEHSVVGRSVVVHERPDDEGRGNNEQSLKTGNSGGRLACGVIGLTKQFKSVAPSVN